MALRGRSSEMPCSGVTVSTRTGASLCGCTVMFVWKPAEGALLGSKIVVVIRRCSVAVGAFARLAYEMVRRYAWNAAKDTKPWASSTLDRAIALNANVSLRPAGKALPRSTSSSPSAVLWMTTVAWTKCVSSSSSTTASAGSTGTGLWSSTKVALWVRPDVGDSRRGSSLTMTMVMRLCTGTLQAMLSLTRTVITRSVGVGSSASLL